MSESEELLWRQIDHKLVKLKLESAFRDYVDGINSCLDLVMETSDDPITDRIQTWTMDMSSWAKIVYEIYDEVWRKQGNQKTPQFIRVVCRKGIIPSIQWLCGQIRRKLKRYAEPQVLSASLEFYADKCKKEWLNKCEIEAHEFAYIRALPADVNPAATPPPPNEVRNNSTIAETESPERKKSEPFDPNRHGGKETAIAVSYHKDGKRDMRKLSRILADKAHISCERSQYHDPKQWFQDDPSGFRNHIYKLRKKASKKGWFENVPAQYWRSYGS